MKKKPLAPRARILWVSALHQLGIPGRCPQSQQHPPAPGTDESRCCRPGRGRFVPQAAEDPRRARGRHFPPEHPRSSPAPGVPTERGPPRHASRPRSPRRRPSPPADPEGTSLPCPLGLCERGAKKLKEEGGCTRQAASPRAGRGRGLNGADAQPVGRVLQGLQGLLVGFVVVLHGARGEAMRLARQRLLGPNRDGGAPRGL